MSDFMKIFNCDASNVTGLVDGLEQKNLASRYEIQQDRRLKMVKLEAKGRRVRTALIKGLTHGSPLLARLNPDELTIFVELLRKITSGVQDV
jgi:DNA-binding MarR family transcriptional regulator